MTQLSSSQYIRLSQPKDYASSDGLYYDKTNNKLVIVDGGTIRAYIDANGIQADFELSGEARGDISRRGASAWEAHSAKTSGQLLGGDGTDVKSMPVTGDVSLAHSAGNLVSTVANLTQAGQAAGDLIYRDAAATFARLAKGTAGQGLSMNAAENAPVWTDSGGLISTVTLTPTTIEGNAAGDLGHANGVQLVAGVASKVIVPTAVSINFTYGTAAYADGGNLSVGYAGGGAITGVISAAASLNAVASNINLLFPLEGLALVNTALVLRSAAPFTNAGGATGTASVKTHYRLLTV